MTSGVAGRLRQGLLREHEMAATGRRHEIYLDDPRRTDPRLKVVLRQPARKDQALSRQCSSSCGALPIARRNLRPVPSGLVTVASTRSASGSFWCLAVEVWSLVFAAPHFYWASAQLHGTLDPHTPTVLLAIEPWFVLKGLVYGGMALTHRQRPQQPPYLADASSAGDGWRVHGHQHPGTLIGANGCSTARPAGGCPPERAAALIARRGVVMATGRSGRGRRAAAGGGPGPAPRARSP